MLSVQQGGIRYHLKKSLVWLDSGLNPGLPDYKRTLYSLGWWPGQLGQWPGYYTRMLRAILNRSWQQHPTRRQLYGHLPPITKTIQARRTRHAGHCWRSKDEIVSDVLLWTPTYGQSKAGRPARTFIQQLCDDTGCNPEDLPEAMNDRETWRERVRDIRASRTSWWWWWSYDNHPTEKETFWRNRKNRNDIIKRIFTVELLITVFCEGVCVCVEYICLLLCVVFYEIICLCRMINAPRGRFEYMCSDV